jgi:hypothetical protein
MKIDLKFARYWKFHMVHHVFILSDDSDELKDADKAWG